MKTLYLVRHAKSEQYGAFSSDFERPLNERGKRDAPVMAKRLMTKGKVPDALVSSPAIRALSTCQAFADVFSMHYDAIIQVPDLYHASSDTMLSVIAGLPDTLQTVALFTHNPGITDLANRLVHGLRIDNMPTCAILAVQANTLQWNQFPVVEKTFLYFDYPKNIS